MSAGWPWLRLPPSLPAGRLRHSCGPGQLARILSAALRVGWPLISCAGAHYARAYTGVRISTARAKSWGCGLAAPASLRRQLRWLRPQRRGKGWPYRDYRGGGGGAGRPSRNPRSPAGSRALRRWRSADPAGAAGVGLRRCDLNGAPIVSCKMAA